MARLFELNVGIMIPSILDAFEGEKPKLQKVLDGVYYFEGDENSLNEKKLDQLKSEALQIRGREDLSHLEQLMYDKQHAAVSENTMTLFFSIASTTHQGPLFQQAKSRLDTFWYVNLLSKQERILSGSGLTDEDLNIPDFEGFGATFTELRTEYEALRDA